MTLEEFAVSLGYRPMEDGRFATPDGESFIGREEMEQMAYASGPQYNPNEGFQTAHQFGYDADPLINGVQYRSLPRDPESIARLIGMGLNVQNHPQYGWIAPDDANYAAAFPDRSSSSGFEFGPFILAGGLAALAAGAGGLGVGALANSGGALSDAAIADIVAAEGGFSALPSAGMTGASGAALPAAKTIATGAGKGALTGGIISGLQGGNPIKGALAGAVTGGVTSAAAPFVSGLTPYSAVNQAIGSAGIGALTTGIRGGDPVAGAINAGVNSGANSVINMTWNAAKGMWEAPGASSGALVQADEWNIPPGTGMLAAGPGFSGLIDVPSYNSLDEAKQDNPGFPNWRIEPNGALTATGANGVERMVGWLAPGAVESEISRLGQQDRQDVGVAEQAQQEQEAAYAAQWAETQRVAQWQAQLEAQQRFFEEQMMAWQAAQVQQEQIRQQQAAEPARLAVAPAQTVTDGGGVLVGGSGVLNALPGAIEVGLGPAGPAAGDTNMAQEDDFLLNYFDELSGYDPFTGYSPPAQLPSIDDVYVNRAIGPDTVLSGNPSTSAQDTLGLMQMGRDAGLSGDSLARFVASGGTQGSTAAGGGGVGYGAGIPFGASGGSASGGAGGSSQATGGASTVNIYNQQPTNDLFSLQNLAKILGIGAGVAGVASIADKGLGGGSTTTQTTSVPGPSAEELELIKLNAELARKQIASIDQLQPFQKALLEASYADLAQQQALSKATNAAISPEEQAALARAEFERSQRLGPIQEQLLQKQLDIINRNGAATPEQEALIRSAADAAIESGTADINLQAKRGIGLISDELANARGLRLTDTPILREATLLSDRAGDQVANLVRNIRASEATAKLNYPLAVGQMQSNIAQGQQSIADAAKNFQNQLRQQAVLNRQSMLGQTSSTGIGLANTGNSSSALNALLSARLSGGTRTSDTTQGIGLTGLGQLASGIGNLMTATSRL